MSIIRTENLTKVYGAGETAITALAEMRIVVVGDISKFSPDLSHFGPLTTWRAEDLMPGVHAAE